MISLIALIIENTKRDSKTKKKTTTTTTKQNQLTIFAKYNSSPYRKSQI